MKERPILFSGPLVRAILDGAKTQTRRVVKWRPLEHGLNLQASSLVAGDYFTGAPNAGQVLYSMSGGCWNQRTKPVKCPYGVPGDRLWVRETWSQDGASSIYPFPGVWYRTDYVNGAIGDFELHERDCAGNSADCLACWREDNGKFHWRPSIHMPRWASRITLEVTGVRVERLQAISEDDARAEGIERVGGAASCNPWRNYLQGAPGEMVQHCSAATRSFQTLWDSLAKPGAKWDDNPWVWVVEFKRVTP